MTGNITFDSSHEDSRHAPIPIAHALDWLLFRSSDLPIEDREALLECGRLRQFEPDEVVVAQDVCHQTLDLILSGSLKIERHSPTTVVPLGVLTTGETVGEISFLDPGGTSAEVRALEESRVFTIDREDFAHFMVVHSRAASVILKNLGRDLTQKLRLCDKQLLHCAEGRF